MTELSHNDIHLWLTRQKGLETKTYLRDVLSNYLPLPLHKIHIAKTQNGKPYLKDRRFRRLQFNVSHNQGTLVCAVSYAQQLGVDIEHTQRKNRLDEIAERYFHPQEIQQLHKLANEEERRQLFFNLWTSKEAYIKAIGKTIGTASLDEVAFSCENNRIQPLFNTPIQQQWHFKTLPWHDHIIAVAIAHRSWQSIKPEISLFEYKM